MQLLLNPQEAALLHAYRKLRPEAAAELSALVERLAALAPDKKVDWSDSWSEEDLRDFRAASIKRLDLSENEDIL